MRRDGGVVLLSLTSVLFLLSASLRLATCAPEVSHAARDGETQKGFLSSYFFVFSKYYRLHQKLIRMNIEVRIEKKKKRNY